MVSAQLTADATDLAKRLASLEVWDRFEPEHCIVIQCPDEPLPLLCSVVARAEALPNFHLFCGSNALEGFEAFQRDLEYGNQGDTDPVQVLGFRHEPHSHLLGEECSRLWQASPDPGQEEVVPSFFCEQPFSKRGFPNEEELLLLTRAMTGILRAAQEGLLVPTTLDRGRLCTVIIEDEQTESTPEVTVELRELPRPSILRFPGAEVSIARLDDLPRGHMTWQVASRPLPTIMFDDPELIRVIMAVDSASEVVLTCEKYASRSLQDVADILVRACRSTRGPNDEPHGVPERIIFESRRLAEGLGPALLKAGILCEHDPDLPPVRETIQDFLESVIERARCKLDYYLARAAISDEIPAPDDLDGWTAVDSVLRLEFQRVRDATDTLTSERALKRYFDQGDPEYLFEEYCPDGINLAYNTWSILDYRPTRKSRTQAEKMLESPKDMPRPMQILLFNMVRSRPSLFRVEQVDSEKLTLKMADLLLGGTTSVHDETLAKVSEVGDGLVGRIYKAGNHRFFLPTGPYFWQEYVDSALAFLEQNKLKRTPSGLRQEAHKFGWLWALIDEQCKNEAQLPQFRNTSGEEILWHNAVFEMEDEDSVRRLLQDKDNVTQQDESSFVWLSGPEDSLPEDTILGTVRFKEGRLTLETNSFQRFETGRRWLLEFPGVHLLDVTTRDALEGPEESDFEEGDFETTPEMAGAIQGKIDDYYMHWLDTSLPVLEGLTPRQACESAPGQEKVTRLIREMPDPSGSSTVKVPRGRMLRELGLDPNASQRLLPFMAEAPEPEKQDAFAPLGSYASQTAPGKNSQCPCGSGRKYKNCCGK